MFKKKYFIKSDLESFGREYLKKGLSHTVEKKFAKGSLYFQQALDIITCDCNSTKWIQSTVLDLNKIIINGELFDDNKYKEANPEDYFFCKAIILSYTKIQKYNHLGLEAIENYLKIKKDHYGYYILGKIQSNLKLYDQCYSSIKKGISIKNTNSLLYKLGRIKEQHLHENGVKELYTAFINNPSSSCAVRVLKKYANQRDIIIDNLGRKGHLTQSFNVDEDEDVFEQLYQKFLGKESNFQFDNLKNSSNKNVADLFQSLQLHRNSFINSKYNANKRNETYFHNNHNWNQIYSSFNDEYYNDQLDMDQQSPEFWDSI